MTPQSGVDLALDGISGAIPEDAMLLSSGEFVDLAGRVSSLVEAYVKGQFDSPPGRIPLVTAVDSLLSIGMTSSAISILSRSAWASRHLGLEGPEQAGLLERAARIALEENNPELAAGLLEQAQSLDPSEDTSQIDLLYGEIHLARGEPGEAAARFSRACEKAARGEGIDLAAAPVKLACTYTDIAGTSDDERRKTYFLERAEELLTSAANPNPLALAMIRIEQGAADEARDLLAVADGIRECRTNRQYCFALARAAVILGDREGLIRNCLLGISTLSEAPLWHVRSNREIARFLELSQSLEPSSEPRSVFFSGDGAGLVAKAVEFSDRRDEYLGGDHSVRVAALATGAALHMGWPSLPDGRYSAAKVDVGARLHDIGKLGIPWRVLNGVDAVSSEERTLLTRHPQAGGAFCRSIGVDSVARMVEEHHEAPDGSGYPEGSDSLSPEGRLLSAANALVVLTSDSRRAPCPVMSIPEALEAMAAAGRKYDEEVLRALREASV